MLWTVRDENRYMGFILAKINFSRGMFVCYKKQTLVFNRLNQNRPKENLNSITTHPLIYFNQSVNIGGNSQGPFSGALVKILFSTRLKITSILERLYKNAILNLADKNTL